MSVNTACWLAAVVAVLDWNRVAIVRK
jgi:hypothetical protein